jgi:hypothetical protein
MTPQLIPERILNLTSTRANEIIKRSPIISALAELYNYDQNDEKNLIIDFSRFSRTKELRISILDDIARYYMWDSSSPILSSSGEASLEETLTYIDDFHELSDFFMLEYIYAFKKQLSNPNMGMFLNSINGDLAQRVVTDRRTRQLMANTGFFDSIPYYNLVKAERALQIKDYSIPFPKGSSITPHNMLAGTPRVDMQAHYDRYIDINIQDKFKQLFGDALMWYNKQKEYGFVVAGGFLTNLMYGTTTWQNGSVPYMNGSDLDIFFCCSNSDKYNKDAKINLFVTCFQNFTSQINKHLCKQGRKYRFNLNSSYNCKVIDGYILQRVRSADKYNALIKIQFICNVFETPSHILHGFDLEPCKILFDGEDTYMQLNFLNTLNTNWMLLDQDKISASWRYRYAKYCKKYQLDILLPGIKPELSKMMYIDAMEPPQVLFSMPRMPIMIALMASIYNPKHPPCSIYSDYDMLEKMDIKDWFYWTSRDAYKLAIRNCTEWISCRLKTSIDKYTDVFTGAFNPVKLNIYDGIFEYYNRSKMRVGWGEAVPPEAQ